MLFIPLFIILYMKLDPVTRKNAFSFHLKTNAINAIVIVRHGGSQERAGR
jgi:hypothetical protein